MFRTFLICFLTFLLVATSLQASAIKFAAYPNVLKANISSSASMRCSLADTPTGGQIGKRSVTNTAENILHISSILITRNNAEGVASVTSVDGPIAEADVNNLQAKGDVSGTSGQGYLELTWKDPSAMVMGEYVCEINAITHNHHSVVFTSNLEITEVAPTLMDVIDKLNKQEAEIADLKQQQTALKQCASRRVGFMAAMSTGKTITPNQPVVFDKVIYSDGGSYDQNTGKFTCFEPGLYSFTIHAVSGEHQDIGLNLRWNNNVVTSVYTWGTEWQAGSTSMLLQLKANDVIQVMTDARHKSVFYQDTHVFQPNVFVGHMVQGDCED